MAQPYTIRLTTAQVDILTQSGRRSLREGIEQLITAAVPETVITDTPPQQSSTSSHTITVTTTITIDD